jgi:serine/threonine protein kinase
MFLFLALHDSYFIHRDIKLSNFMMGGGIEKHMLYLIDFGLSKQYKNSYGEHIATDQKYRVNIGTKVSLNCHRRL